MKNLIEDCTGFQWDEGNLDKNWILHQVSNSECEEIFFNLPLILAPDTQHTLTEQRYYALGRTDSNRWLFIAFTIREQLIRVISARDMNERRTNMPTEYKNIPAFENEDDERAFWATHDSTDFLNWDDAESVVLPQLKPSTKTISLRLPEIMLNELRVIANKRDVPYQTLIKVFLKERIDQELKQNPA